MTLIEVLVASTILGVGVTGLLSAATLAMRNQHRSEQRAVALALAQEKMSEIELIGPHVWMLGRPSTGSEERGEQTYQWTTQIEQQPVGELFAVQVRIEWSGQAGGQVQLSTWLNDYAAKAAEAPQAKKKPDISSVNRPDRGQ